MSVRPYSVIEHNIILESSIRRTEIGRGWGETNTVCVVDLTRKFYVQTIILRREVSGGNREVK